MEMMSRRWRPMSLPDRIELRREPAALVAIVAKDERVARGRTKRRHLAAAVSDPSSPGLGLVTGGPSRGLRTCGCGRRPGDTAPGIGQNVDSWHRVRSTTRPKEGMWSMMPRSTWL